MPIGKLPTLCVIASMLLASSCGSTAIPAGATATEQARCAAWAESLPSRSHQDTAETQAEIGLAYGVFAASCPHTPLPE